MIQQARFVRRPQWMIPLCLIRGFGADRNRWRCGKTDFPAGLISVQLHFACHITSTSRTEISAGALGFYHVRCDFGVLFLLAHFLSGRAERKWAQRTDPVGLRTRRYKEELC
jgi:hypothetical protein